jgi:thymidylate synthase ThyX
MTVELIAIILNAEAVIEKAGRTCYCSTPKAQLAGEKNLIYRIIKNGHHSVLEQDVA